MERGRDEIEFYVEWNRQFSSRGRRRPRTWFHVEPSLETRHVTIFKPDVFLFIPLFILLSLSRSLSPSRGRDLLTCTETFNFARRDGHWISPTNRIIRGKLSSIFSSGLPWKSPWPPSSSSRVHFRFDGELRLDGRLNGFNNQRAFYQTISFLDESKISTIIY